jgi:3-oxoacyl-[acyl-carrier-protein] synthase II
MIARAKSRRRVVVTGMGAITSLGVEVNEVWNAVLAGRSGVSWIQSFDARGLPIQLASEVDLARLPAPEPGLLHLLSRSGRFGLAALSSAWRDAGLDSFTGLDRARLAVCVGASSLPTLEHYLDFGAGGQFDAKGVLDLMSERPGLLAQRNIPFIGTLLAQAVRAGGPCLTVQTACSSANQALGEAFHLVGDGRADVVVSGGADSMLSLFCVVGFTLLGALARCDEPSKASRPFDATRNGFVLGEGSGLVVLEELEHALRRKATIHAEVVGYGASSDGHRLTDVHPEGNGAAACMQRALACAGIAPTDVDYINAHGTSTTQNDRVETLAIKRVFGDYARRLPVSSTKSQLGHLVCAAGGIEFVLCVMALKNAIMPATINLERADPECDLDYVPNQPRPKALRIVLSNSFGFGGQNGTVVLKRWEDSSASGEI